MINNMSYDSLRADQHYVMGPPAVHTRRLPSTEVQNNVPYNMFKPYRYSEGRVLQLLKRGIGQNGSIRSHGPAVRKSVVESLKPYPKLFQHYVQS